MKKTIYLTFFFAATVLITTAVCVPSDYPANFSLRLTLMNLLGASIFFMTVFFPRLWPLPTTSTVILMLCLSRIPALFFPGGSSTLLAWLASGLVVAFVQKSKTKVALLLLTWLLLGLTWTMTEICAQRSRPSRQHRFPQRAMFALCKTGHGGLLPPLEQRI